MGLFAQQPEEDDEWAGIPSEPLRPETEAERLTDAATLDATLDAATLGLGGLGGLGGIGGPAGVQSIVIPVAPAIEIAGPQEQPESG
jgi:hypothetical protein